MAQTRTTTEKGFSLAKGPVGITGLVLLAAGILGLLFAGHSFPTNEAVSGTVNVGGDKFLGFGGNGWTWALTGVAGLLLLLAAPLHWGAKTMSIVVGLALGAASVIALVDKDDVFGLASANGPTKLLWGAAAALLLILALLPRVGKKDRIDEDRVVEHRVRERRPVERETVRERPVVEDRPRGEVVDRNVTRGERVSTDREGTRGERVSTDRVVSDGEGLGREREGRIVDTADDRNPERRPR